MTTLESRKSSGRSPLRLGLFLIPFSVASALAVSAFITFATNMRAETCVTPRSGLVSWWPGDGNANDIVGSNNNGTLENGATFSSGEVEQAFSFDGVDDYVVIPNIVNAWPEGTIEAWINYINPNPGGVGGSYIFAATENSPLTGEFDGTNLGIHPEAGSDLRFGTYTDEDGWNWAESGITPTAGQWYHVTGTWGPDGTKIYINGVLKGTNSYNGPSHTTNFNIIGASSWPGSSVNAFIDEVSIYNRALSDTEIQAIANAGSAGKCKYAVQLQQPINADGTSVFNVKRGVVPVKFRFTQDSVATCALPPATIALTRTAGGTTGAIDESVYTGSADTGSNFRIADCQYIYNLTASALGVGTYLVDIKINGNVVGYATFQLK